MLWYTCLTDPTALQKKGPKLLKCFITTRTPKDAGGWCSPPLPDQDRGTPPPLPPQPGQGYQALPLPRTEYPSPPGRTGYPSLPLHLFLPPPRTDQDRVPPPLSRARTVVWCERYAQKDFLVEDKRNLHFVVKGYVWMWAFTVSWKLHTTLHVNNYCSQTIPWTSHYFIKSAIFRIFKLKGQYLTFR